MIIKVHRFCKIYCLLIEVYSSRLTTFNFWVSCLMQNLYLSGRLEVWLVGLIGRIATSAPSWGWRLLWSHSHYELWLKCTACYGALLFKSQNWRNQREYKLGLSWAKLSPIKIEIELTNFENFDKLMKFIQINSLS